MEPQDDAEARIRELERPLADAARTSERGAEQYTSGSDAYTSTPLPPYGTPYAAAPRKVSAGFPPWFWVIALVVVALVVIGAGIAFFAVNTATRGGSVTSPPVGRSGVAGGGPVGSAPGGQPSTPGGGLVSTAPPGGSLSVAGISQNKTIACNDSSVSVSGVSNTVTITGHCVRLTVSGMQNLVTVDSADTIGASGFGNHITYHSGAPQVQNLGGSNVVRQR